MIMTVITNLLYVRITWLPNNISLYALLNMLKMATLSPNYRIGGHERILCEGYGMKKWSPLLIQGDKKNGNFWKTQQKLKKSKKKKLLTKIEPLQFAF